MVRILIIDDEIQIREMLKKMLERAGYEIVAATNGEEAIRLYHEGPADLVITDIIMPEKEGIETIRELRHDYPDVKIIAISGGGRVAGNDYLNMAMKFGVQRIFAKPFDRKEMLEAVRDLVGSGNP